MSKQGFWIVEIKSLNQDLVENWDFRESRPKRLGFFSCRDFFDMSRQSLWKCWNFLTTLRLGFFSCQYWEFWLRPCWKLRLKGIETRWYMVFESVEIFSHMSRPGFWTVEIEDLDQDLVENWVLRVSRPIETWFLKVLRFSPHVKARFLNCQDRESGSRPWWKLRL